MPREQMQYDVVIVGAGPAGLSAAIRLKQLSPELSVCIVEKGAEVGAHLLSGAVLEPKALNELIPNWAELGAPLNVPVTQDKLYYLTQQQSLRLPLLPQQHNQGNYIISLDVFAKWLAGQAEALGVEIFAGFAASELLSDETGRITGIATGAMGIGRDGKPTANYTEGVELLCQQLLVAEGCRGSLTRQLEERFKLRAECGPQTYALGVKEVWEIDPSLHQPGYVQHTIGWPMDAKTYGGSWLYHYERNLVSIGFVVGLDYENPYLSPFEEMQRFKHHPLIAKTLAGGRRIAYGARALVEGGYQAIPKLSFPGGLLIGDAAGFLNVAKIKGNHLAMKSGMVAAEAVVANLTATEITDYRARLDASWLVPELHQVRNIRPAFHWGLYVGALLAGLDALLFRGRAPWTFKHKGGDHTKLKLAAHSAKINYPKPDGVLSFDRLSSVYMSNTNHTEDQPCHLTLKDATVPIAHNLKLYDAPEQRYCPAGVYEIVGPAEAPQLQINAQNCVHCKTCDIKDPTQNIVWVPPQGGEGPGYEVM